jgi:hypothetical protein
MVSSGKLPDPAAGIGRALVGFAGWLAQAITLHLNRNLSAQCFVIIYKTRRSMKTKITIFQIALFSAVFFWSCNASGLSKIYFSFTSLVLTVSTTFLPDGRIPSRAFAPPSTMISPSTRILYSPYCPLTFSTSTCSSRSILAATRTAWIPETQKGQYRIVIRATILLLLMGSINCSFAQSSNTIHDSGHDAKILYQQPRLLKFSVGRFEGKIL